MKQLILLVFFLPTLLSAQINSALNEFEQNCESARKKYLEQNQDVKNAGLDPMWHYNYYGKKEGRKWPACNEINYNDLQVQTNNTNNVEPKSVVIGTQTWTTENLNVSTFRNGDLIPEAKTSEDWISAGKNGRPAWCYYDNDPKNGETYGKLYNWYAVNDLRGIAPEGWRIVTDEDWDIAIKFLGGERLANSTMKSKKEWLNGENGSNQSGLTILPSGLRYDNGNFGYSQQHGVYWSNSSKDAKTAFYRYFDFPQGGISRLAHDKSHGFSVRCVKEVNNANGDSNSEDIVPNDISFLETNNNITPAKLKSVVIGTQTWTTENLNVSTFQNGDMIHEARTVEEWRNAGEKKQPAWCFYNNDPKNGEKYGKIYNWYAVNDPRGIAPDGWHVATENEWIELISQAGGLDNGMSKLVSCNDWRSIINCHDRFGFSALPGNARDRDGKFGLPGYGIWWTSSSEGSYSSKRVFFNSDLNNIEFNGGDNRYGFSVRCVKNSIFAKTNVESKKESLNKNTNDVVDADGNVYKTVRIRDKIWITENLKTKHYNNGVPIPYVEELSKWTQISTPAYCEPSPYYDNQNEGLLYNHYVVEKGGVCPEGFKIPTASVIDSLLEYYNGNVFGYLLGGSWSGAYDKTVDFDDIKSGKAKGFNSYPLSGFNFLNGASREAFSDKSDIYDNGYSEYIEAFWLKDRNSKFDDEQYANTLELKWGEYDYNQDGDINGDHIRSGNYIRCYKEYTPSIPVQKVEKLNDKDGNSYKVVRIGNQIWMAEDLKTIPSEGAKVVFSDEELKHYGYGSMFYDNYNKTQAVNYSQYNFNLFIDNQFVYQDICPQGWHLPDQGEWEIMIRNSKISDLKSTTGWLIDKRPGYYETKTTDCNNCKGWNDLYRANKRGCDVCKDEKRLIIKTGKYIPEKITNYNGTNKSGLNLKPYPIYGYGKFEKNERNAYYLVKNHRSKGVGIVSFSLDEIEFSKYSGGDTFGHVRCIKD